MDRQWLSQLESNLNDDYRDAIDLLRELLDSELYFSDGSCAEQCDSETAFSVNLSSGQVIGEDQYQSRTPKIFADLSNEELQAIEAGNPYRSFNAGEVVYSRGEEGSSLYVIKSGKATMEIVANGNLCFIATLAEGDFFGEMAFFTFARRAATVRAFTDLVTLEINRDQFADIISEHPDTIRHLADQFAIRMNELKRYVHSRQ